MLRAFLLSLLLCCSALAQQPTIIAGGVRVTNESDRPAAVVTASVESELIKTAAPLNNGSSWVSPVEQCRGDALFFQVFADTSYTITVEFSVDGVNWDSSLSYTGAANIPELHRLIVGRRYLRMTIANNSGSNQTELRAATYYGNFGPATVGRNLTVGTDNDTLLVRSLNYFIEQAQGRYAGESVVRKFGRNSDIDTGATETIWANGGTYTFPAAAQTLDVVSSSGNDTSAGTGARTIELFGLDGSYDEVSETVTLNGTSAVTTSNTYLRFNRGIVRTAGSGGQNAGTITIDQTTSGTVVAGISPGINQTQLGVYTVPNNTTAYMMGVNVGAMKGSSSGVDVDMFVRPVGEVFQLKGTYGAHTTAGGSVNPFTVPIVLAEHTDVRFDGTVTANNTQVFVEFPMVLIGD